MFQFQLRLLLALSLLLVGVSAPAFGQISVLSNLSADQDAAPGTTYTGEIVLKNESGRPQEVKVYQTDYAFASDGSSSFETAGSSPRSNAAWIVLGAQRLTLAPQETRRLPYSVAVPTQVSGTETSGTYWSMVMVEGIAAGSAESTQGNATRPQVGLQQVTRYGVQIASNVGASARVAIDFSGARVVEVEGRRILEIDVVNTGDWFANTSAYIEVFGASGTAHGRRDGSAFRLYPGTSVRQRISLDGLAPGTYEVLAVVDAGTASVFGGQFTVTF